MEEHTDEIMLALLAVSEAPIDHDPDDCWDCCVRAISANAATFVLNGGGSEVDPPMIRYAKEFNRLLKIAVEQRMREYERKSDSH